VPSRRLGRSLGIDLVPFKTCSFDCIFCQLGRTTNKTVARREYVSTDEVCEELRDWCGSGNTADAITLAGSGEPTLHSRFGEIIDVARRASDIPVVLLTNGSLLSDPAVRAQASGADIVKASLSAWDDASLQHVNRPHPDIGFAALVDGIRCFREQFRGALWLEVFLVWGSNATPAEVAAIADIAHTIGPDTVQLNTAVRPPCEEYAYAVPGELMAQLAHQFEPVADVIAEYSSDSPTPGSASERDLVAMIRRRPCTLEQICRAFGLHRNEAVKYLGRLTRTGEVELQHRGDAAYFIARTDESADQGA
jgi:wyosine [tRNA(Phe)-imidazoG37] synthetase (radical SAM superfamily)